MEATVIIGLYNGQIFGPYSPEQLSIREQSSTVYMDTLYSVASTKLATLRKVCQLGSWQDYIKYTSKHTKVL